MDYKEIIKKRRLKMGLNQNKFTFMNEIESSRKSFSVEVLIRICKELDIKIFCAEQ